MELSPGMIVYMNHYSGKSPIISSVIDINGEVVKIQLTQAFKDVRIGKNHPLVIGFEDNKKLFTCEGYVLEISETLKSVDLRIDNIQAYDDARLFERFPVCLYATTTISGGKKHVAIVKNVSLTGMAITSKVDFKCGQNFDYEVYIEEKVIKIKGEVAWKKKDGVSYEYGIKSTYPDYVEKNTVRLYLSILKNEQRTMINDEKICASNALINDTKCSKKI